MFGRNLQDENLDEIYSGGGREGAQGGGRGGVRYLGGKPLNS